MDAVPEYRRFLDYLIDSSESSVPRDRVMLFGDTGSGNAPSGTVYGQAVCVDVSPRRRYFILISLDDHEGEPRQELFNTIAHEFRHVEQFEAGTSCAAPTDDSAEDHVWEAEAEAFADTMAPRCN
jgi:hypothetical protein